MENDNFDIKEFRNVPFGNSVFQILNFTDGKESPARRYRHCLLQLHQKINTLKECEFRRKRSEIDIEELKCNIKNALSFNKRRLEVDLEEKEYGLKTEIKLIEDCMVEVNTYKTILKKLPTFTRSEFEGEEQIYWEKRLLADARRELTSTGTIGVGVISSLEGVGLFISRDKQGQIVYNKEENDDLLCDNTTNSDRK